MGNNTTSPSRPKVEKKDGARPAIAQGRLLKHRTAVNYSAVARLSRFYEYWQLAANHRVRFLDGAKHLFSALFPPIAKTYSDLNI